MSPRHLGPLNVERPQNGGDRNLYVRSCCDRGEVSTTLLVFAFLMIAFYSAVHFALVFHAHSVTAAAAQDGLRAAQLEGGTTADAEAAANRTLGLAPGLRGLSVSAEQTDDNVTITVTAEVETVLVELFNEIEVEVTGPRERFYSEMERR